MIEYSFFGYFITGFGGMFASVFFSIFLDVPPPTHITPENIVNIVTQITILAGTLFGFYVKYQELKKIKKNRKK